MITDEKGGVCELLLHWRTFKMGWLLLECNNWKCVALSLTLSRYHKYLLPTFIKQVFYCVALQQLWYIGAGWKWCHYSRTSKCSPYAQLKNKKLSGSEVTFDRLAWTDPFELTLFSLLAENLILTTYIVEIEKCNKDNNLNSVGIYWCCRKKVFPY